MIKKTGSTSYDINCDYCHKIINIYNCSSHANLVKIIYDMCWTVNDIYRHTELMCDVCNKKLKN